MSIQGELSDRPLTDLLRSLARDRRSGRAIVLAPAEMALLWVQDGQVVNAIIMRKEDNCPLYTGEAALVRMCSWSEGSYSFAPGEQHVSVAIKRSLTALLGKARQVGARTGSRRSCH